MQRELECGPPVHERRFADADEDQLGRFAPQVDAVAAARRDGKVATCPTQHRQPGLQFVARLGRTRQRSEDLQPSATHRALFLPDRMSSRTR